jgi:hypothetical protein
MMSETIDESVPLRAHKPPFRRYRQSRKYEVTSARVQAVSVNC